MKKKDKIVAVLYNPKKDSIWYVRQKLILKSELKKRRCYCKFYLECEFFYVESYTCTHKGSDYCGKYRDFISKKVTYNSRILRIKR